MNSYQISDLERLTGIKAHTIRIWERRYNLIAPHRTATNIRYYDDEQAKKLLKVSTLLARGMKISKISLLTEKQLNSHIKESQLLAGDDTIGEGFINDLTATMLVFDESGFEKVLSSAIVRFGVYEAMIKVFYPFLKKTGLMWTANDVMPVQEHFATAIIRRKLIVAIDGLPLPTRKSKTFLLFLPMEEWHETALLLSDYLIRSKGYKTIYLSQNVPVANLQGAIDSTKPSHILTFYIARQEPENIALELQELSKKNKKTRILVGGTYSLLTNVKKSENVSLLSSPADLLDLLKR